MGIKRGRVWWLVVVFVGAVVSLGRDTGAQGGTSLHGRVRILMPDGSSQNAQDAVVWLSGAAPPQPDSQQATSGRPKMAPQKMASDGKRFLPRVVAIQAGETVDFPNVDRIFHNAFSVSPGNQFDLGLYRKGASKSQTFTTPGVVHVYCNIHQDMAGYVLVLPSARAVVTGADGGFRFTDVKPGRQNMKVWHPMTGEIDVAIDLQPGAARQWDVELDATRFRRVAHKNKYGKDYPPMRKDADRY
jgi:plastocyanin